MSLEVTSELPKTLKNNLISWFSIAVKKEKSVRSLDSVEIGTLEDGTDRLSWNVGEELPFYTL